MVPKQTIIYRGHEVSYDDLKPHSIKQIKVICDACGKEFISTKYQIIRNGHQKCQQCALRESHEKTIEIGTVFSRLKVIEKSQLCGFSICRCSCGKVVNVQNYNLRAGITKSCGCLQREKARDNMLKYSSGATGEKHHNWKGGLSPVRNRMEATKKYKILRQKLLSTMPCAKCGTRLDLVTHHIIPFCKNNDLLTDENNIAVLCSSCHRKYHNIYGFNGNSEMFSEFLNSK